MAISRLNDEPDTPPDAVDWRTILNARESRKSLTADGHLGQNRLCTIFRPFLDARQACKRMVVGQLGQSLDGRIATATGHSHYINGAAALLHLHRLRALVDGVIIGVGSVLADDPQLTVRRCTGPQPTRVIIDPRGRMGPEHRCLRADGARRIVVQARPIERPDGVETIILPSEDNAFDANHILDALAEAGLRILLVEGGAATLSAMLAARGLDRLHLLVAPLIIGSGRPGIVLPEIARLDDALRPATRSYPLDGGDVLFDCDLRSTA